MTITEPQATSESPTTPDEKATDALVEKLFGAVLGAQQVQAAYLGDRFGWYETLATGPRTSSELAAATGTAERYAREWLEHQVVAGYLRLREPERRSARTPFRDATCAHPGTGRPRAPGIPWSRSPAWSPASARCSTPSRRPIATTPAFRGTRTAATLASPRLRRTVRCSCSSWGPSTSPPSPK